MSAERRDIMQAALPEAAYRALVEAAPDIVAVFHDNGTIRYVNAAATSVLGYRPGEVVGRSAQEFFHPDDAGRAAEHLAEVRNALVAEARPAVYRVRCRDGRYRHLETLALNRLGDPEIDGIFLIARDVTRRIELEGERLAVQERRRLVAEVARLGIWEWNLETNEMVADEAVREIGRTRPGQAWAGPDEFLQRLHEDDREPFSRSLRDAAAGREACRQVVRMPMEDGSQRWLYVYAQRLPGQDPAGAWLVGLIMDVTAQKRVEQEMSRRGELLELASRGAGFGAWTWYPLEGRAVIDERSIELLGLPGNHPERPTAECNSRVHPDDRGELERLEQAMVAGERERFDYAYRVQRDDGLWHWLLDRGRASERDGSGRATRVSGITLDISGEKRKEQDLEEQRLRLSLALRAAQLGLWDYDAERGELYVDRRYTEITQLTQEDFRRDHLALANAIREEDRPALVASVRDLMAGRSDTLSFEGRLPGRNGRLAWIHVDGVVAARHADGSPARIIGTIADITERRDLEAAVLESSSREQQRLGHELHDGLGQELTGIALLLQGVAGQAKAGNPALVAPFDRLSALLSTAIRNTRLLAHGLAPVTTAQGGLESALRLLAERSTSSYGVAVALDLDLDRPLALDECTGGDLYRIAQEALSNAVRHGRATTVTIRLATTADRLELEVSDDGRGLPAGAGMGDGMGLRGMAYRVRNLRGSLEFLERAGGGTRVRVGVPLPAA